MRKRLLALAFQGCLWRPEIIYILEGRVMAENQGGGGGDKLVYFLVGAGIGAITALLFAPKSGSELRSDLADATRKGLDYRPGHRA